MRTILLILFGLVLFFHRACEGSNHKKRRADDAGIVTAAHIHHVKRQQHEYAFPKEDTLSESAKQILEKLTATLIITMPTALIRLIAGYVDNFSIEAIAYINLNNKTSLQRLNKLSIPYRNLEIFESQKNDQLPICTAYFFTNNDLCKPSPHRELDSGLKSLLNITDDIALTRHLSPPTFTSSPYTLAPLLTINTIWMAAILLESKLTLEKRDNPFAKECQENSLIFYASSVEGLENGLPVMLGRIYTYLKTEQDTREITSFHAVDSIYGRYADTVLEKYPLMRGKLEQLGADTTGDLRPIFYNGESLEKAVQSLPKS